MLVWPQGSVLLCAVLNAALMIGCVQFETEVTASSGSARHHVDAPDAGIAKLSPLSYDSSPS